MECQKDFLHHQLVTVVSGMHTYVVKGNCVICLLMCLDIERDNTLHIIVTEADCFVGVLD